MKTALGLGLVMLLMCAPALATPIQVGDAFDIAFSGHSCPLCWSYPPDPNLPDVTLQGVMTVVLTTGNFYDVLYQEYFRQAQMITNLTGTVTIDCKGYVVGCSQGTWNMVFLQAPFGDGSWVSYSGYVSSEYVTFTVDGLPFNWRIFSEPGYSNLQGGVNVPISFGGTKVPESSSLALLGFGLAGLWWMKSSRLRGRSMKHR